ncbi:MAG TPA: biotin/lipoate A/B protein ligase family protein [Nitrososphaera sp.]|jgi:lipoate-protein ligase A|nr:biotin/lipoate A/B protein ligase family protein [Nitrososphaera sp.]
MTNTGRFDKIRTLETGYNTAALNMAIDEALMENVDEVPILRIYRWCPTAVSIGYFQSMKEEVDLEKCREIGVDVVRRLTGGGAVLHEFELTYSFMTKKYPQNIMESYRWICDAIVMSINRLGFDASFVPLNDIVIAGKKVSGNAQTRRNGVLLQHGTLLLDVDVNKMFCVLKVPSEKLRDKLIKDVKERVTSLSGTTFEDLASSLRISFAAKFDAKLVDDNLSKEELSRARWLAERKYTNKEWNLIR